MGHHHEKGAHGAHVHDTTLLTSKDVTNPGVKITRIGLLVNLALVLIKATAGVLLHSSSLLADAGHSAADILSDILTLSTITFSQREPNLRYPLGYGKVETLGAIGVSSLLLLGGVGIGLSSLDQLMVTLPPNTLPAILEDLIHAGHGHGHSHGTIVGADPMALWVAAGSVAVKEWLFRATKKVALETNSTVLLANAWHHRTDALTSLVALAAIAAGQFYPFLDPVGGCLVSLLIIKVGYQSGRAACQEIVDRGLEPEILLSVREAATHAVLDVAKTQLGEKGVKGEGVVVVGGVAGTKSGAYYIVDVELEGPGGMTVDAFERVKLGVVEGVKADVKGVKIVRVFIKTHEKKGNDTTEI